MPFEPNTIYHVYNQGNNRQAIFFQPRNYAFFLRKMQTHLLPYAELLCYCLMPNHFHWLIYTKPEGCALSRAKKPRRRIPYPASLKGLPTQGSVSAPDDGQSEDDYQPLLSQQIGILLSSYTRAINVQEERSGSLFRRRTKAKNGWIDGLITLEGPHRHRFFLPDNDYARQCFQYIHQNPVKAGLTSGPAQWLYSSFRDYAGLRQKTLCNQRLAQRLLDLPAERA